VAAACAAAFAPAAAPAAERPSFAGSGAMQPSFDWRARDYALRGCEADEPVRLKVRGAKGWATAVGGGKLRGGGYGKRVRAGAGEKTVVKFKKRGRKAIRRYHLRCLPSDFPGYRFERERTGGPRLFSIQLGEHYGAIFDRWGAPVWWVKANGEPTNIGVLPDGTMTWSPVDEIASQVGDLEVRTIRNKLLHRFSGAPGTTADVHELLLLPNGNYMFGAQVIYRDDTSAFGGTANSEVVGIEIQEYEPNGKLAWRWSSRGRIGLEETGRWWDAEILDDEPYDVVHWNAVEDDGRHVLVSMRHTDAIYKIDKRSGDVVWKLGGTKTPESLKVRNDPLGDYPLGGQHDARVGPDGSVTIFDNRTDLPEPPRALRYKVNEDRGTARLVESVTDPDVTFSVCCASARLLDNGDWMIGWGGNPEAGNAAYDELGRLIFRLALDVGFTYRAIPVPKGAAKPKQLRKAMNAMSSRG
jgi:hypothetical protein